MGKVTGDRSRVTGQRFYCRYINLSTFVLKLFFLLIIILFATESSRRFKMSESRFFLMPMQLYVAPIFVFLALIGTWLSFNWPIRHKANHGHTRLKRSKKISICLIWMFVPLLISYKKYVMMRGVQNGTLFLQCFFFTSWAQLCSALNTSSRKYHIHIICNLIV